MNKARSWKPRLSSPGVCDTGRPICQESSVASSSARATHHSAMRRQIAARSATGTCFQAFCALTAMKRARSMAGFDASGARRRPSRRRE